MKQFYWLPLWASLFWAPVALAQEGAPPASPNGGGVPAAAPSNSQDAVPEPGPATTGASRSETAPARPGPGSPSDPSLPLEDSLPGFRRVGIALLGVCVLCYALLYLYRRFVTHQIRTRGPGGGRRIRVSESVPLGNKRFLCTVEAGGRTLLLGISGDRIHLLGDLTGAGGGEESFGQAMEEAATGPGGPFPGGGA